MAWLIRIIRVRPNGTEQIVRDLTFADVNEEQLTRAEAFADAETRKASGLHIRVYTSQDDGTFLPGDFDLVWDSEINL